MKEEVKRIAEALKLTNSRLFSIEKLNAAMYQALSKLLELEMGADARGKVEGLNGQGDYVS